MFKFLTSLVQQISSGASRGAASTCATACIGWLRDPLAHPAVDVMSLSELADLPAGQLRARLRD
jgi:hypothetical protein